MLTGLFHIKQRGSREPDERKQSEDEAKKMMQKGSGESLWESESHMVLH